MGRMVCFIDKIGLPGTCGKETVGKTINCKKCGFYKKFKGKEKEFIYCFWKDEIKNYKSQ